MSWFEYRSQALLLQLTWKQKPEHSSRQKEEDIGFCFVLFCFIPNKKFMFIMLQKEGTWAKVYWLASLSSHEYNQ